MTAVLLFETADGPVPFEIPEDPDAVESFSVPDDSLMGRSAERLEDALDVIRRVAGSVRRLLVGLDADAEVTIGVKLAAEGGFIVAKTSAEASLSVKLKLPKQPAAEPVGA
ncbi:MAG TPA: CU044_2847 family protein [Allosphingosinicella sp.]|jgi:hypothetical protein